MTFEDYKKYYKKFGMCPGDAFKRKNPYTIKQFKTKYEKYCKKQESKIMKNQELRKLAMERDKHCQIFYTLSKEQQLNINQIMSKDLNHLDMAHVFNKSSFPHLRYDIDNVVMIKRIFHNRLDTHLDPITGSHLTNEKTENWWRRIIGKCRYENLKNRIYNRKENV